MLPVATLAGASAAVLQLAGALKTAPPLSALPFDLTLLAFLLLLPAAAVLAATRRWRIERAIALPLAAAALLLLWLVLAGAWSPSREVLARKLPELALVAPPMLAAGMLVGAEPTARRVLTATTVLVGLALAGVVALGAIAGAPPRSAAELDAARLQYQLAGLGMAMAAALLAIRAVESRHHLAALPPLAAVLALAAAATLPGGRTALVALGLGVVLAPAAALGLAGRRGAATLWILAGLAAALGAVLFLALRPEVAEGLRTLERLAGDGAGLEARLGLWGAALAWAGEAAPLGLGTGGFTIAAGHGERRGLYPHNHALEALAEAGLPGLVLWLGAFGGAVLAAAVLARRVAPARAGRILALVLPVALSVMVSTDLGNRMAWFALGLALSLGVDAVRPERAHV
jgi:O-antigen ligase